MTQDRKEYYREWRRLNAGHVKAYDRQRYPKERQYRIKKALEWHLANREYRLMKMRERRNGKTNPSAARGA